MGLSPGKRLQSCERKGWQSFLSPSLLAPPLTEEKDYNLIFPLPLNEVWFYKSARAICMALTPWEKGISALRKANKLTEEGTCILCLSAYKNLSTLLWDWVYLTQDEWKFCAVQFHMPVAIPSCTLNTCFANLTNVRKVGKIGWHQHGRLLEKPPNQPVGKYPLFLGLQPHVQHIQPPYSRTTPLNRASHKTMRTTRDLCCSCRICGEILAKLTKGVLQ